LLFIGNICRIVINFVIVDLSITDDWCTADCTVRWQRAPGVVLRKENVVLTPEDGTD